VVKYYRGIPCFGYAKWATNQGAECFRYAGLVIIGSGFFDPGRRDVCGPGASNQVTRFGGFFDSVY